MDTTSNPNGPAPTLYLIDVSSYVFRAYHAIAGLSNSQGMPTNALFGFCQMLQSLLDEQDPQYLAAVFDTHEPTFRKQLYPAYKANRPPLPADLAEQLPWVARIVDGYRIARCQRAGYEADDLIATLATHATAAGWSVVIVGSDKDLMQLVGPNVTLLDTMKGARVGQTEVEAKFGVGPEQVIEVQALAGDSSDNIPGVRGIGLKGAADLIRQFGNLESLYDHLGEIPGKRQENLRACRQDAFLSRQLATLVRDVPLDSPLSDLRRVSPDAHALHDLFLQLEFRRMAARYVLDPAEDQGYHTVLSMEALDAMTAALRRGPALAFDLETTSLDPARARIVGLSFCADGRNAYYVPVGHEGLDMPTQLPLQAVLAALRPLLEDPALPKYGQNQKYDDAILLCHGIDVQGVIFDAMLGSYLLDPDRRRHSLDAMAADYLHVKTITYEEVTGKGRNQKCFSAVPIDQATRYSAEDAHVTHRLCEYLRPHVQAAGLEPVLHTLELPLSRVLARMELAGVLIDRQRLGEISRTLGARMAELEQDAWKEAGTVFNLGSPKQLQSVLFERLALKPHRRTQTGFSTDSEVLEELTEFHPLPGIVLQWRAMTKLKSTYSDALPTLINPLTGRLHTSLNQAVAATGRLSSSEPNLQNIPVRTPEGRQIRTAFVAPAGHVLMSADYSQIELRVLAHLSEDPALLEAFRSDQDVHVRTAAEIFDVAPQAVTREQRGAAKTINFGVIYGMGSVRLARTLGIERKKAQNIIDRYFERYPFIKRYFDGVLESARDCGEVRTLAGRRRLLPDLRSANPRIRAMAERTAVNTPVQGSAADIIKRAMLGVDAALRAARLTTRMILQVHDELLLEVPLAELEAATAIVREQMEQATALLVPLKTDIHTGANWSEAH